MTAKNEILNWMRNERYAGKELIPGGLIEDYLREIKGMKGGTTSRRLRELENDGFLEANYEKIFVRYKLRE